MEYFGKGEGNVKTDPGFQTRIMKRRSSSETGRSRQTTSLKGGEVVSLVLDVLILQSQDILAFVTLSRKEQ